MRRLHPTLDASNGCHCALTIPTDTCYGLRADAEIEALGLVDLVDAQLSGSAHVLLVHIVRHEAGARVADGPHERSARGEIGAKVCAYVREERACRSRWS